MLVSRMHAWIWLTIRKIQTITRLIRLTLNTNDDSLSSKYTDSNFDGRKLNYILAQSVNWSLYRQCTQIGTPATRVTQSLSQQVNKQLVSESVVWQSSQLVSLILSASQSLTETFSQPASPLNESIFIILHECFLLSSVNHVNVLNIEQLTRLPNANN